MNNLIVDLENCYGIRKLTHEFDFNKCNTFSIYAPNGFMKTSFSKTFKDHQNNQETKDLVFTDRVSKRLILDGESSVINPESIFVIDSYNESYSSEKASLLLVNNTLKEKYISAIKDLEEKNTSLIKKLKQLSGINSKNQSLTEELCQSFSVPHDKLFELYETLSRSEKNKELSSIIYTSVFNEKTLKFLDDKEVKQRLHEYIDRYNDLISASPVLNRNFNHYNAQQVTKNLSDNGFFKASHFVTIKNGENNIEIKDPIELDKLIREEKSKILKDESLSRSFEQIDKKLSNVELRTFRDYLFDNRELLPKLSDLNKLKKEIWLSYIADNEDLLLDVIKAYEASKDVINEASNQAVAEETQWQKVVHIFNKRFHVPFKLSIENQSDVILNGKPPHVSFDFSDETEMVKIEKSALLQVLSQGEKRALYILNLLFEVNARISSNIESLFIVDDIADSFDYKNKYAIIEYFKEICEKPIFKVIFLTHNFDFHRTISGRLGIERENRLVVHKENNSLKLNIEKYQNNPFVYWKENIKIRKFYIASIPFVRNLCEYCGNNKEFENLTSLLHSKKDTGNILVSDLERIYKNTLIDKSQLVLSEGNRVVKCIIFEEAEDIYYRRSQNADLESKIIIAIAIRLLAEFFMKIKIDDEIFFSSISKNQTIALYRKFIELKPAESEAIALLTQVNLMTPENIHLNSFMFEPILDMSCEHLYALYGSLKQLLDDSI
jgi:ABC-type lipoprotein export system ATPase subunit